MTSPLAGQRVLVVDDERAVASAVAKRLEREGAIVQSVHAGGEASQKLAAGVFDLVVSDVHMPGRSGLELAEEAQRLADPPAVLLMAADGEVNGAADAITRGADGYLRKPLDVELMAHEAMVALEMRALRRAVDGIGVGKVAGAVLVVVGEIVNAFEKADPYRAGYSVRTGRLAVALASALGLDADRVALAARVHDVGMLAVPITELHSEGPPDRTSQHLIRVHPTLGARWIERLGAERMVVAAVAAHHERFDGTGYPGGLKGADIPPEARCLGIAAAIAAMSLPRPWRERYELHAICDEIKGQRGIQFGAAEVDAALDLLQKMPAIIG